MNGRLKSIILATALSMSLTGCFTGVESTPPVTSADVQRALSRQDVAAHRRLVELQDSVASWRVGGKRFIVTDNQARLLFVRPTSFDIDTVPLQGRILTYRGFDTGDALTGDDDVNLHFDDGVHQYTYDTGRTLASLGTNYRIPLLIDLDMVAAVDALLRGKRMFVMTSIWYDPTTEQMSRGRQYVAVTIDSVTPGNKVLPLRVHFTVEDNRRHAMVWMSDGTVVMPGRDLAAMFHEGDPHAEHRDIDDNTWTLITQGQVAIGMTKAECRLSRGAPQRIAADPDQQGLRERWIYEGGSYLYFVDGRLESYR